MSSETHTSPEKIKKRPSVSSKCLLTIKSIVTQNVSANSSNKTRGIRSPISATAPLPLVDSFVSTKDSNKHSDNVKEIDERNRKKPQIVSTRRIVIDSKNNFDLKKASDREIITTNGHDRTKFENEKSKLSSTELSRRSISKTEQENIQTSSSSISDKESKSEQNSSQISVPMNKKEPSNIPPLPLNSSVYSLGSYSSANHIKPLLSSFPTQSSNRINEEYIAQLCHIIESSTSSNETKPDEGSTHRSQSIPIHRFDSTSPSISTIDEDDDNFNGPIAIVNSSLNMPPDSTNSNQPMKSRLSDRSEKEYHNNRKMTINNHSQYSAPNPHCSTSYTRLPHALRNMSPAFNHSSQSGTIRPLINTARPIRRQYPQFESVRTPVHKSLSLTQQQSPSTIPSEVFNCCQTENISLTTESITIKRNSRQRNSQQSTSIETSLNESEARSNYFRNVANIREIMINASNRLTKDIGSISTLPIVDTHCHFDLIFDRLRIKHNDLKQYFKDYSEYYPSGLSFELAIQVFWRPKQLSESNWTTWFSRYLDDERIYGACGIHPHWSSAWDETSAADIERCLMHPKIVAIGEIGLDFGPKNTCLVHEQCRAFEEQLKLAAKWLKPIVIHSRDAYEQTFQLLKKYLQSDHKIHLHCFVGTMDDVNLFTSYFTEIKFGFTPIITRYNFLHTTIQQLELTQILSETDSPYFTPDELSPFSRCAHPGMVYSVVEMVAQLRHLPVMDVACQLRENARHIYGV
ncbi:unnamed protein product [Rotaria socialis]|uniref:Uncharacterized protein n=1 Tax=Rotaria socialis TaxID=392032 RepID=A0A818R813_9BILA|nr:unnamed protein product [Rotaria socialis]CAF4479209.1 unnamed protein product [Rotaria socialis]